MKVLVNGEAGDGRLDVTSSAVMRGDGCFEAIRVYSGVPFEAHRHLSRLESSADKLGISLPVRADLKQWVDEVAAGEESAIVRVLVTRGQVTASVPAPEVVVFAHQFVQPDGPMRILPVSAPWLATGWALAGAKTLSYAPNVSASRAARSEGYDDALLTSRDGMILEGPTFSVGWVVSGRLELPSLELGILDSVTRQLVQEDATSIGVEVAQGAWRYSRLEKASEVLVMSTVREVQPVAAVGELDFESGELTEALRLAFAQRTGRGVSGQGSTSASPAQETRR